ncbi:hypothetical protein [Streptomyces sp. NBC_00151]|uniref:hypothetical protein n=1 Tax=Streptomyces sp. NBC_00151 TaxID=2975669 RepID=UPI002DD95B4B|nr:hypothetical protein [Streptomyces sp. NBC_00151]WRZ41873.1 hypothetical protein OG915_29840 [Streptomyces sp. NBC_00151]
MRAVQAARSDLLDTAGLGLLSTSAFLWSPIAGFAAAGVAVLALNWRMESGSGE